MVKQTRYCIYARESNREKDDSQSGSRTIENQIATIRRYIQKYSGEGQQFEGFVETEVFSDKLSGRYMNRPSLLDMINKAKRKMFTWIFITDTNRLARNMKHSLQLYDTLVRDAKMHIYLTNLKKEYDLVVLEDWVLFRQKQFMDAFYPMEVSMKVKRVYTLKKEKSKKTGKKLKWGRPSYTEMDPNLKEDILRIKKEHPGWGYRKISKELGIRKLKKRDKNGLVVGYITRKIAPSTIYYIYQGVKQQSYKSKLDKKVGQSVHKKGNI